MPNSFPQLYEAAVNHAEVVDRMELDPSNTRPKYLYEGTRLTIAPLYHSVRSCASDQGVWPPTIHSVLPRLMVKRLRTQNTPRS